MKKNIGLGVLIILFAVVYLLNALGHNIGFDFIGLFVGFVALDTLIKSLLKKRIYGTVVSLAMLYYAGMRLLEQTTLGFWTLLAFSLILSFGLSLIFTKQKNVVVFNMSNDKKQNNDSNYSSFEDSYIDINTTFGEVKKYVTTDDLRQCDISCTFGEVVLYFENAIIKDSAVANISCSFGEVVLYIPKEWNVVSDVSVTFGEQHVQKNDNGEKVFKISGLVTFGEVKVFYI